MKVQDLNIQIQSLSPYLSKYCKRHPLISAIVIILVVVYAIPISVFLAVGIVSFLLTFSGFLIIEGAIMIVAFIILISVLSTLTVFIILASLTCWLSYLITSQVYLAMNNLTPQNSENIDQVHSFEHEE